MSYKTIIATVTDGVGLMKFNRPERKNAVSQAMFAEMYDCLEKWETDPDVAVVVMTGGEEIFSSGLDLEELKHHNEAEEDLHAQWIYKFYYKNATYPKPMVAAMAGPVLGGGADFAEFCDFRIAAENVTIGFPQIKFGWIPYPDPLWRIVGISKAKELQWTGRILDVEEAKTIGLIDRVVPVGKVVEEALAFSTKMARNGTKILTLAKELFNHSITLSTDSSFRYTHAVFRGISTNPKIKATIEDTVASLEKKKREG